LQVKTPFRRRRVSGRPSFAPNFAPDFALPRQGMVQGRGAAEERLGDSALEVGALRSPPGLTVSGSLGFVVCIRMMKRSARRS
jgi:hypothetical protein